MINVKLGLWLAVLLMSPLVFVRHNVEGLDLFKLYSEVMPPGLPAEQLPEINSQAEQLTRLPFIDEVSII